MRFFCFAVWIQVVKDGTWNALGCTYVYVYLCEWFVSAPDGLADSLWVSGDVAAPRCIGIGPME